MSSMLKHFPPRTIRYIENPPFSDGFSRILDDVNIHNVPDPGMIDARKLLELERETLDPATTKAVWKPVKKWTW